MLAGFIGCLGLAAYTGLQGAWGNSGYNELKSAASEMTLVSQQVSDKARATRNGDPAAFQQLGGFVENFQDLASEVNLGGLGSEISGVNSHWQGVQSSAQVLVSSSESAVLLADISGLMDAGLDNVQKDLAAVVKAAQSESGDAALTALRLLWISERIAHNLSDIQAGKASPDAGQEFRADATYFAQAINSLAEGNPAMGVPRLADTSARAALARVNDVFKGVVAAADQVAGAQSALAQAEMAREAIASAQGGLNNELARLPVAVERLAQNGGVRGDRYVLPLSGAAVFLFAALGVLIWRGRQKLRYQTQGVEQLKVALNKLSAGDLSVRVPENNTMVKEVARSVARTAETISHLVNQVKSGIQEGQVLVETSKTIAGRQEGAGRAQTKQIADSTSAAGELKRNSNEISKAVTQTSQATQRNLDLVRRGSDMVAEMVRSFEDMRGSIQALSKRAKRQGESSQEIASAIEDITEILMKVQVVAINSRIEATKAGEQGAMFMGVAEAIADLAREASDVSKSITQRARAIESHSAEVIDGMESTVAQVVSNDRLLTSLNEQLSGIRTGSENLADVTKGVAAGASQSADRADHMAALMDGISSANLDIAEFSASNADNANKIADILTSVDYVVTHFRPEGRGSQPGPSAHGLQPLPQTPKRRDAGVELNRFQPA